MITSVIIAFLTTTVSIVTFSSEQVSVEGAA